MPQSLPYAAPIPWYQRRRRLSLLTLIVLFVGYLLALPQYRVFRQHQIRRTEIRKQLRAEINAAHKALDAGQIDPAAMSLLNAEFPIRTEQVLFWTSEVDRYKAELKPLRARLLLLSAKIDAEDERRNAIASEKLATQVEEEERRGVYVCRLGIRRSAAVYRKNTLAALNTLAITYLKNHNYPGALQVCRQIVDLEPDHIFDNAFWANAQ